MSHLLLYFFLTQPALAKEPNAQDDLYIWKSPYLPRTLARFQHTGGYSFALREVPKELHERVQIAKEKDFGDQCGDSAPRNWPIYQYDLGPDGKLLMVSCISRSMDSWSVYYHHTQHDQLKPITVQFPILSTKGTHTKITGFQEQSILKNSEILQRRVVSRHRESQGDIRQYRAEWVWKEGYGLELIEYSVVSYDKTNQPTENILYQGQ